MPDELMPQSSMPVASWRRYIILGGVALVAIGASIALVLRRPAATNNSNSIENSSTPSGQNTISGRPTFERFQAATKNQNANVPTATTPTLEQTQQAIKELQQK